MKCFGLQLENLPAMVAGVWTEDGNLQLEATTQFRKLLSIGNHCYYGFMIFFSFSTLVVTWTFSCSLIIFFTERSPPIEEVIQAGVVPRFVQFLMRDDFPQLQVFMPCFHNLEVLYGVEKQSYSA